MFKYKLFVSMLLLGIAGVANALQTPEPPAEGDSRIRYISYHPDQVVRVDAGVGYTTRIVFSVGEEILDIASGFSEGWHFMVRKNILYLKPKTEMADTNIEIQTNKRAYSFEARVVGKGNTIAVAVPGKAYTQASDWGLTQDAMYRIQFIYPEDEKIKQKEVAEKEKVKLALETAKVHVRNWNYTMQVRKGSDAIVPKAAFDDGRFTYFRFPSNREFPAIYAVRDDDSEQILNFHVEDDWVIVQRLAKKFYFRINNQTVAVYNEAFDPDGVPSPDGSTVGDVERTIRKSGE